MGVTLLQSATKYRYEESSMAALNIPLASANWNALSKANISALDDWGSDLVEKQLLSYMFRLNYDYNSRYLLTVSGRWVALRSLPKVINGHFSLVRRWAGVLIRKDFCRM